MRVDFGVEYGFPNKIINGYVRAVCSGQSKECCTNDDCNGDKYSMIFNYYDEFFWKLDVHSIGAPLSYKCQYLDEELNLYVTCADYASDKYGLKIIYDIGIFWEMDLDTSHGMAPGECD